MYNITPVIIVRQFHSILNCYSMLIVYDQKIICYICDQILENLRTIYTQMK